MAPAHESHVFEITGLAGSLRRGSFNRALLRAAAESAPPGLRITTCEIGELPLYKVQ
ncbi:MAG TPA: NAD(P)H-dependent oxidoreductase [Vicinamibacterales bacterium]|nr:NAD(P)H-dependent oxidoreductase [Vicinamibacterales bacterium]